MKILLINPPFNRLKGIKEFYFPLGLGYLAAVLEKEGHHVRIYNMDAPNSNEKVVKYKNGFTQQMKSHHLYLKSVNDLNHLVWQELKNVLNKFNPDIVALTAASTKFQSACYVAQICKEFNNKIMTVVGGPHPTICPDESIKNKSFDFIVRGEGEITMIELCRSISEGSSYNQIEGISYLKNEKIVHCQDRKLMKNLDELPFPSRHLVLFPERYSSDHFGSLVTMRGCPFRCGFCAAQCMWTRKVRTRSINNIIKEIKFIIKDFNIKSLFFWDDSFSMNRKRTINLCDAIIKNNLKISWGCSTKVTLLDEELVNLMKKAGCSSIELGVESGSERMLKIIKKDITLSQVKKATNLLDKYHINYTQMLMVGFPEETEFDINQTIRFIKKVKKGFFCLSVFTPYPGTELFNSAMNLGLIPKQIDWQHFSHQSPENSFTKYLPKEKLIFYIKKMNELVDNHNGSFSRRIEYVLSRAGFFSRNPRFFFNKFLEELMRK